MTRFPGEIIQTLITLFLVPLLFLTGCKNEKTIEKRIVFPKESWQRYQMLDFELPVTESNRSCDLLFIFRCRKSFAYDEIPLNMVLNTPSGEERIKEYQIQIRDKNGSYTGTLSGDTCITQLVLKRNLSCPKKGMLKVEIENLNPRMETEGVFSAGLMLIQH